MAMRKLNTSNMIDSGLFVFCFCFLFGAFGFVWFFFCQFKVGKFFKKDMVAAIKFCIRIPTLSGVENLREVFLED